VDHQLHKASENRAQPQACRIPWLAFIDNKKITSRDTTVERKGSLAVTELGYLPPTA
jgi:hypothetical protein